MSRFDDLLEPLDELSVPPDLWQQCSDLGVPARRRRRRRQVARSAAVLVPAALMLLGATVYLSSRAVTLPDHIACALPPIPAAAEDSDIAVIRATGEDPRVLCAPEVNRHVVEPQHKVTAADLAICVTATGVLHVVPGEGRTCEAMQLSEPTPDFSEHLRRTAAAMSAVEATIEECTGRRESVARVQAVLVRYDLREWAVREREEGDAPCTAFDSFAGPQIIVLQSISAETLDTNGPRVSMRWTVLAETSPGNQD